MGSGRNFALRYNVGKAEKSERTDSAFKKERDRIRTANAEKTARLRSLRLAKEAAEREAAELAAAQSGVDAGAQPKKARKRDADKPSKGVESMPKADKTLR